MLVKSNTCSVRGIELLGLGQLELLESSLDSPPVLAPPGTQYGEIFTRPWIVEMILDLVGYGAEVDLGRKVIVEPSCGMGAFLAPMVDRLIRSTRAHGHRLDSLEPAIRAYDLLDANVQVARKVVAERLVDGGLAIDAASAMADKWVTTQDFLLSDEHLAADFVVGNPPYIRLEDVPPNVMKRYRTRCSTMRGRSDIYVGFIERGLSLLRDGGTLGYICADRWMRNQYGAALRELVAARFAVDAIISMHDVDAFEDAVSAYPAVIVLRNGRPEPSVVAEASSHFDPQQAVALTRWIIDSEASKLESRGLSAARLAEWPHGADLWPAGGPDTLQLLADLERRFPQLEDHCTGTRVGIGLATGCDDVYLTRDPGVVESDRLLPMVKAADIASGRQIWSGTYLINPWDERGLVDLGNYPRLGQYLEANEERLRGRHIARKRPNQWFRTIDRVDPTLTTRPKLLLPDLKAAAHPVIDRGDAYPHHNLYYVVSDKWDLEVLGGLLLSEVTNLFVGAYCVKMRGGCYRFQAQYLRRIRVPNPESLSRSEKVGLASAFRDRDVQGATRIALKLYGLEGLPPRLGRW